MKLSEARIILGINEKATDSEVKQAYREKSLQYHPDRSPAEEKTTNEEMMKLLTLAYRVITKEEEADPESEVNAPEEEKTNRTTSASTPSPDYTAQTTYEALMILILRQMLDIKLRNFVQQHQRTFTGYSRQRQDPFKMDMIKNQDTISSNYTYIVKNTYSK